MFRVCATYYDTVIGLDTFKTKEEAENFMKKPCYIEYDDDYADVIEPSQMYIEGYSGDTYPEIDEDELPF